MTLQESLLQLQKLTEENASLRKQIAVKDATILKQELEIDRLRKIIFGKKSERFISTDPNARQLDIFGEPLSDREKAALEKAAQQEQELITRTITVNKPRTPRKDISLEGLRVEETIIDPEGINDQEYVCIGSEETSRLALKPAEFYIKKTIRRKYVLKNQSDL